MQIYGYFV
jgi:hypothetical protein